MLDAGAGAAVHLRADGADWLFDTGSARDYGRFLRDYLHSRGIDRLDSLVLSHGDSLHIGGASAVEDEFRPRRVIDNGASDRSSVHQALVVRLGEREIAASMVLPSPSAAMSRPASSIPPGSKAKAADDQTLVVQLIIAGKHRVLLVSDGGQKRRVHSFSGLNDLRSDILIKGQHYSGESGSAAFLDAVQPQLIVATSVDFPARERIPDAWARMVRERGIELLRQDETGAVTLEFFRDAGARPIPESRNSFAARADKSARPPPENASRKSLGEKSRSRASIFNKRRRQNQLAHGREIILLVGRDAKAPVRHEQPVHQGQKIGAHDAPAPMLFLGPRIGEEQMRHIDRSWRKQILDGVGALNAQDADVRQVQPGRLLAGPPHPAGEFLEAKKIPFRKSLSQRHEKGAVAASDIDLKRRRAWKNLRQIERREIVRRNQFDFGCDRRGAGIFFGHISRRA